MDATFYTTNKGESGWVDNIIFTNDKYLIFIEEIKTILDTKAGKVLGAEGMDGDLERFIFMKYVDVKDVEKKIREQIHKYSMMINEFDTNIKVDFADGTNNKICVIQMSITHIETPDLTEKITVVYS